MLAYVRIKQQASMTVFLSQMAQISAALQRSSKAKAGAAGSAGKTAAAAAAAAAQCPGTTAAALAAGAGHVAQQAAQQAVAAPKQQTALKVRVAEGSPYNAAGALATGTKLQCAGTKLRAPLTSYHRSAMFH